MLKIAFTDFKATETEKSSIRAGERQCKEHNTF